MPLSRSDVVARFAAASERGNAALFVGAGMSVGAGLPSWTELLGQPLAESDIPPEPDLPLLAEYLLLDGTYSRGRLEGHILRAITEGAPQPTRDHAAIAQLPIDLVFTTNYDYLLEAALGDQAHIIATDDDVRLAGGAVRTLIKMHGSVTTEQPYEWLSPPVITRTDYEEYEQRRPRMWAMLNAAYLSRTMLFLGFSFTDPNVAVLQSLARRLGVAVGNRHMAVLRRPDDSTGQRAFDLKTGDLERNGVGVLPVTDFGEIHSVLDDLLLRTRPPKLFVAGSCPGPDQHRYAGSSQSRV